jgi:2-haloacid dehalogenase
MAGIKAIIFDLGGVLIDWNPLYVFNETYFENDEKRHFFFERICTADWNEAQDAGYPIAQATEDKVREFPEWESAIRDYYGRWKEMLGGPIEDSVQLLWKLRQREELKLFALTNWSAETFPIALERFDFLHWFHGRVVSGEERTRKPFPEFYKILLNRYELKPSEVIFIDDNFRNVIAAERLGFCSIHFTGAADLERNLSQLLNISFNR